jgi:hypothetical protein
LPGRFELVFSPAGAELHRCSRVGFAVHHRRDGLWLANRSGKTTMPVSPGCGITGSQAMPPSARHGRPQRPWHERAL